MSFFVVLFIVFIMITFLNNKIDSYINYEEQLNKIKGSKQLKPLRNYRNNEFNYSIDVIEENPEPVSSTFFSKV